jgi:hypothetical protein
VAIRISVERKIFVDKLSRVPSLNARALFKDVYDRPDQKPRHDREFQEAASDRKGWRHVLLAIHMNCRGSIYVFS